MSMLLESDKNHKKFFHRRNGSAEIDVFEAARYFSGYNEAVCYNASTTYTQKIMRDERHGYRGRISLDMPMRNLLLQHSNVVEKQKKEKKHKQPSSPGGRLASFLNSLFNQSALKKKKSKSTTQSMKDDDESPGVRRKRRSSISHFRSSGTNSDSKSIYSSSSSGFRTPPPYSQTVTKSYREFRSYSDHKQAAFSLSKNNNEHVKSTTTLQNEFLNDKKKRELPWLGERHKLKNGLSEKHRNLDNELELYEKEERIWVDKYSSEEKEFRSFNKMDDGAESDSSSDLFELQNYDLGYSSSGLPVYETTNMDTIKRGAPISNVPP
ncbi:protein BIG GRAIN 1-like E [Quillaja saponaria]|uniref:Protein BIG GRAIN 1-like E n=1 Tax=Quillaja saponaria TaxID=32244 RepID=A0AAD7PFQ8_QUISA|nr:protein BIG GRAIN 1-like E [Quillaja saponaria]